MPVTSMSRAAARLRAVLPRGGSLPVQVWEARHRGVLLLAWLHVPVLLAVAQWQTGDPVHAVVEAGLVGLLALLAGWRRLGRSWRASLTTLSLLTSSAVLIHLFAGLIELHFHFFVVVAIVSLYQLWTPYLIGLGFVLAHHAVAGVIAADLVYNHGLAHSHPVGFAVLHAGFVLAESIACVLYWRLTEQALDAERSQRQQLEEANVALSTASARISDLVGMMSHDLKTPATVVTGFAEEALESWDDLTDERRREFVGRIAQAGRSLQDLLESGLTVSALDTDALTAHPSAVRLDALVREVLAGLPRPLEDLEVSMTEETVLADRMHLTQVVTNLVTNAAKYGAPPYRVTVERVGDDQVGLVVGDSGGGVPAEFVPQLFDRYSRSDEARRNGQRGSGLGLFIVQTLVEANHGTITYDEGPEGGARFSVTLPRLGSTIQQPAAARPAYDVTLGR